MLKFISSSHVLICLYSPHGLRWMYRRWPHFAVGLIRLVITSLLLAEVWKWSSNLLEPVPKVELLTAVISVGGGKTEAAATCTCLGTVVTEDFMTLLFSHWRALAAQQPEGSVKPTNTTFQQTFTVSSHIYHGVGCYDKHAKKTTNILNRCVYILCYIFSVFL